MQRGTRRRRHLNLIIERSDHVVTKIRPTKPVVNTEIDPCADLRKEFDDITQGSVIFKTVHVDTLMAWTQERIRMQEEERSKHYRGSDSDKEKAAHAMERIEYYTEILGLLVELRSVE